MPFADGNSRNTGSVVGSGLTTVFYRTTTTATGDSGDEPSAVITRTA